MYADRGYDAQADEVTVECRACKRLVLTVTEAAESLGISRSFAYELVRRGELPAVQLGRRLFVPKKALIDKLDLGRIAVQEDEREVQRPGSAD
jgi:excisionase family DNA binding protein